ncbi:unnamed protein product [Miscanthus lutarioriparius]|uniref:BZIP domain-containing protein n=1 Tax=Miscanthus lutarioriparius TaxID=422564 RepID=A0A811P2N3_9POAL|nr:unnamed protein product [Miscanthus lutarioriparius]
MAKQHTGFGSDHTAGRAGLFPTKPAAAAAASWPEVDAVATAAECVDQRRFRRRISNRESTRRFRARKQRHLDELRDSAALLERGNRDLAAQCTVRKGAVVRGTKITEFITSTIQCFLMTSSALYAVFPLGLR